MAQTQQSKPAAKPQEPSEPTRRMVLRQEAVLVVPPGVSREKAVEAAKVLGIKSGATSGEGPLKMAWLTVGAFDGKTKEEAIEAHAGKPGTPDAKEGAYKAPPLRGWAGGMRLKAPPKPLVEKEAID
jgi:hypothetical protein